MPPCARREQLPFARRRVCAPRTHVRALGRLGQDPRTDVLQHGHDVCVPCGGTPRVCVRACVRVGAHLRRVASVASTGCCRLAVPRIRRRDLGGGNVIRPRCTGANGAARRGVVVRRVLASSQALPTRPADAIASLATSACPPIPARVEGCMSLVAARRNARGRHVVGCRRAVLAHSRTW